MVYIALSVFLIFSVLIYIIYRKTNKQERIKKNTFLQLVGVVVQFSIALILLVTLIFIYQQFLFTDKPICTVKQVEIIEHKEEYEIVMTIMNFGKSIAKNVSFNWDIQIEGSKAPPFRRHLFKKSFLLSPQQEVKESFYIFKDELNNILDKNQIDLSIKLEYENLEGKTEKYVSLYKITKPKTITNKIHITLISSDLEQ